MSCHIKKIAQEKSKGLWDDELSRIVSHALRHEPWVYELELDEEGWVQMDALQIGERKYKHPTILLVKAKIAYQNKINFYLGNERVWLADYIPPEFITSDLRF